MDRSGWLEAILYTLNMVSFEPKLSTNTALANLSTQLPSKRQPFTTLNHNANLHLEVYQKVKRLHLGSNEIDASYLGGNLVFSEQDYVLLSLSMRDGMTVPTSTTLLHLNQLTGLKGDGSTKYIATGVSAATDLLQNDASISVYPTSDRDVGATSLYIASNASNFSVVTNATGFRSRHNSTLSTRHVNISWWLDRNFTRLPVITIGTMLVLWNKCGSICLSSKLNYWSSAMGR